MATNATGILVLREWIAKAKHVEDDGKDCNAIGVGKSSPAQLLPDAVDAGGAT
ncbi:MAG: hypothetical protein H0U88_08895 [Chthoniobacterales bacterium]|nr:hypothetical protein [Chthoniobacterales bacterium]